MPHDFGVILAIEVDGGIRSIAFKEVTHLRHFSKTLSISFTMQFLILFSETLIISQTKSWVSQNIKYKSEFE